MTRNLGLTSFLVAGLFAVGPTVASAQVPSRLVLQIHKVVCVDETDSGVVIGEHGDDHMILGAVTIAPNGRKTMIPTFKVGTFERDGDHKTFSPARLVASIPVATGPRREYGALLVLAEEDVSGGTDEFVRNLVADTSATAHANSDKTDPGASLLAAALAGDVAEELAKRAIERLKVNAKDDIFRPQSITVTLRASDSRFENGETVTTPQTVTFSGHGGTYRVTYSWRLAF